MVMTIDTLDYVKTLEAVGVDRKVAEAHAAAFGRALTGDYVTKGYLDIRLAEVRADIASVKADVLLMKWMAGFILAIRTAILFKLLS